MNRQSLKSYFFICILLSVLGGCINQGKEELNLYFYPSTIRMVNTEKNPALYKAFENVRHLRVLIYEDKLLTTEEIDSIKTATVNAGFEEILSARVQTSDIKVFEQSEKEEVKAMVICVLNSNIQIIFDVDGKVELKEILTLMKEGINLPVLDGFLKNREDKEENARKNKALRDAYFREKQIQDSIQHVQDSLKKSQTP